MSLGGGGGQLQELSQQLQAIESEKEQLNEEIERLRTEKTEIDEAMEALDLLETDSTVQVPLGGGAFVRATIDDIEQVVVELGGGYAAEQGRDDAAETLEGKKDLLDEQIEDVREEISNLDEEGSRIEQQAQQAQQQMIQQQMAQQQGPEDQE